jgi:hypothetical protein
MARTQVDDTVEGLSFRYRKPTEVGIMCDQQFAEFRTPKQVLCCPGNQARPPRPLSEYRNPAFEGTRSRAGGCFRPPGTRTQIASRRDLNLVQRCISYCLRSEMNSSGDVGSIQTRIGCDDFFSARAAGDKLAYELDADSRAPDTRFSSENTRIRGDSESLVHTPNLTWPVSFL